MNNLYKILAWVAVGLSFTAIMLVFFKVRPLELDFFGALVGALTLLVAVIAIISGMNFLYLKGEIKKYLEQEILNTRQVLSLRMDAMAHIERASIYLDKNDTENAVRSLYYGFKFCVESNEILHGCFYPSK